MSVSIVLMLAGAVSLGCHTMVIIPCKKIRFLFQSSIKASPSYIPDSTGR
ncbi:hypothetical protein SOVF_090160 [Spinacia oleracea]|nr:hypothetical protein SOVF_090160 [Spinacia oleracea]